MHLLRKYQNHLQQNHLQPQINGSKSNSTSKKTQADSSKSSNKQIKSQNLTKKNSSVPLASSNSKSEKQSNKKNSNSSITSKTSNQTKDDSNKTSNSSASSNNTKSKKPSNSTKQLDQNSNKSQSSHILPYIFLGIGIALIIGLIVFAIYKIYKRHVTSKKYNQTPEHFTEKPTLSANQKKNLEFNEIKYIWQGSKNQMKDVDIQCNNVYGGKIYSLTFLNTINKGYSAAYWTKLLKTDCYFQVELLNLNSQIQFGFIHKTHFKTLEEGFQKNFSKLAITLNNHGNLQIMGQLKYQFKWDLDYGDVIGMGITKIEGQKRLWITKNGILLNPPTSDEIQNWISKQKLSQDFKETYRGKELPSSINHQQDQKNSKKRLKQDAELAKKKIVLSSSKDFQYYSVIWCWELFDDRDQREKREKYEDSQYYQEKKIIAKPSVVNVNVGGKVFRIRDKNLKTGLLADGYEKIEWCNFLCCQ